MQVMVYPHPALPKPERKTRKTHKNSRDGMFLYDSIKEDVLFLTNI